jgi:hypothetical protein
MVFLIKVSTIFGLILSALNEDTEHKSSKRIPKRKIPIQILLPPCTTTDM